MELPSRFSCFHIIMKLAFIYDCYGVINIFGIARNSTRCPTDNILFILPSIVHHSQRNNYASEMGKNETKNNKWKWFCFFLMLHDDNGTLCIPGAYTLVECMNCGRSRTECIVPVVCICLIKMELLNEYRIFFLSLLSQQHFHHFKNQNKSQRQPFNSRI